MQPVCRAAAIRRFPHFEPELPAAETGVCSRVSNLSRRLQLHWNELPVLAQRRHPYRRRESAATHLGVQPALQVLAHDVDDLCREHLAGA